MEIDPIELLREYFVEFEQAVKSGQKPEQIGKKILFDEANSLLVFH
jgi:hypothetical protein